MYTCAVDQAMDFSVKQNENVHTNCTHTQNTEERERERKRNRHKFEFNPRGNWKTDYLVTH